MSAHFVTTYRIMRIYVNEIQDHWNYIVATFKMADILYPDFYPAFVIFTSKNVISRTL